MTTEKKPDFMTDVMAQLDAGLAGEEVTTTAAVGDDDGTNTPAGDAGDAGAGGDEGTGDGGDPGTEGADGAADAGTEGAADGAGADEAAAAATAAAAAAATAADGRARNVDGTFKSAQQIAADAAAAAKANKKAPDAVNDPIPQGLKKETADRMTKLVSTVKEVTTRAETAEADRDSLIRTVQDAGMNGQEFGEFIAVVSDLKSDDPGRQERAYEYLSNVLANAATVLGKVAPGGDALAGHEDLINRVTAGNLTRADAEALAGARRMQAANTARTQTAQQRNQQQNDQAQALQQAQVDGRAAMIELETTLAAADTNFKAKKAIMAADAPFIARMRATHPSQWATAFNKRYREVQLQAPAGGAGAPGVKKVAGGAPQPQRGKTPAGGRQVTMPKTAAEAVGNIDFSKI